ncbi:MAG: bifunctional oligoribonuclease/PAP phosphatase NrnA [Bacteroidota bacterium]|nr:bifunctional oligoribonuclease/PAP phosphatase NrnA [Candidatus Kapabacteria bacterium]MCS7302169.1 bifunctional oligoribonuclease/PAP phosphatase NrnA [Candidatus Kapabacteria bacterium]MCX7936402.1 bifunctional oligoribonuclease/PAP phosphatase NrnA [Chlorobiota bacterium]MDW8074318.1 bifunctional oligoribonuclease/PAP phosphatase NrnA [Bacteroidota bacterium]MDW8271206.1 bifunctional oligoribonuclease/PAP phosphatase NrnA [Bacteroidota bacterium]
MLEDEFQQYALSARAIAHVLQKSQRIILTTHVRPDGDAIGSLLGLGNALRNIGKQPRLIIPSNVPAFLQFLPGSESIEVYNSLAHDNAIATADVIVFLDFNAVNRLDTMRPIVSSSRAQRVLIDHHLEPEEGFIAMLHDTEVASTAELTFALILLEYPAALQSNVAIPLYTGVLTDTGSFRFPRVTARTHRMVAVFLEHGVQPHCIYEAIYDTNSPVRLRLMGEVLRGLEIECGGQCAILSLRRQQILAYGATEDDTEGFVQYTLTIPGVQVGVFLSEMMAQDAVKVSLRSKGNVSVQRIAEQFGGGGHLNAAGVTIASIPLDRVKKEIVAAIEQQLKGNSE